MSSHSTLEGKYVFNKQEVLRFIENTFRIHPQTLSPISDGIMNTTIKIKGKDGKYYALRIYRNLNLSRARIIKELNFCNALRDADVPVPLVFANIKGKDISSFQTNAGTFNAVMFEFLRGKHLTYNRTDLLPQVATIHAKMHVVGMRFVKDGAHSIRNTIQWLKAERAVAQEKLIQSRSGAAILDQLQVIQKNILAEYKQHVHQIDSVPFALSHLDFDSSNILYENGSVTGVIDFDDIDRAPAILDIGFSLWWWCFYNPNARESILEKYIQAYSRVRTLSKQEKELLLFFIRVRNCILTHLLFVNLPSKPKISLIKRGITFDVWLKTKSR